MGRSGGCLRGFAIVLGGWLAVGALAPVFPWLFEIWIASVAVGLLIGILAGIVLPARVLGGKTGRRPRVATPADVVAGRVLGAAPRGHAKHFGWDWAWPLYVPHQARRDATAVLAQIRTTVRGAFDWLNGKRPRWVWVSVLLPSFAGFGLGVWLTTTVWCLVMGFAGTVVYIIQRLGVLAFGTYDHLVRRGRRATLRCAKCYRVTTVPSYRCSNPACSAIHHDLRPGPLGVVRRRCGCGTSIPATIGGAAKELVTVCPFCLEDVPEGSGTRRVLPLPVIGAIGAGKTQFLCSGLVGLQGRVESLSGTLDPISAVAEEFMDMAFAAVVSGRLVEKTAWISQPEGVPLVLALHGREIEIQLMDAAGENFVDWERAQGLAYIDTADVLLFMLDPLALPNVAEQMRMADGLGAVPIGQGTPEDSYASVVDRLRAEDVRLNSKRLAIVLTKVDILRSLPALDLFDPVESGSIRSWLRSNGADGFVRRVDQDFKSVDYFAVDSCGGRNELDALHPVRVLDWALRLTDPRLSVLPQEAFIPAGKGAV